MKRVWLSTLLILFLASGQAQNIFTLTRMASSIWEPGAGGFNWKTEGSPFLLSRFSNATIYLDQNKIISDIPANLDLQNNEVLVRDEKRKVYAVAVPVYRIVFEDESTGRERTVLSGLPPVDKLTEKSYYELLHPGKLNLLKAITLYWSDSRAYHEAATTRKYEQVATYYLYNAERGMIKLPKSVADIPALIDAGQTNLLTQLIQEHRLNLKTETDLIKLIDLYNNQ